ncbi:MAG: GIY-YIG nuclease family protein [Chloroflexota bacterium]|nr:GIY-YIG nuclease family protein [Chloroflexota bacterium]
MNDQQRAYYVYIMSNRSQTLYVSVTNDLVRRVFEHRNPTQPSFTSRYHVTRLVHFEPFSDVRLAIEREKRIKGWTRAKKLALVAASNPAWADLAEEWLGPTL